jgi:N-formylglutamate deformylase
MEICTILKNQTRIPLLGHIPHSSQYIPQDIRRSLLIGGTELESELLEATDRYVDELFFSIYENGGVSAIYNYSRLVVDPERFEEDELEPLSQRGRGAVYTRTSGGKILRMDHGEKDREALLDRFYSPYHQAVEREVQSLLDDFGECLIIDCHSFSSIPLPFEPDQDSERPDICIGTDPFHTPASLTEAVESFFDGVHLKVNRNKPYAGTYVPSKYMKRDKRVSSIMVEVNRKLYMDEKRGNRGPSFKYMKGLCAQFVRVIITTEISCRISHFGEKVF